MGCISTTAASRSGRSVRRHLTTGATFASAGILALGLVTVPPNVDVARSEVRAVRLAATKVPLAASPAGLLEEFISNQAQTVAPVALAVPGGAADINAVVVTAPFTFESLTDPATDRQQVNSAALSATTIPFDLPGILGPLYPYVGAALLIGGFAVVFLVVLPVVWFVETVASVLGLPSVLPLTATAEASPTPAPTLTSDPPLQATETEKAVVSEPVTPIDKRTAAERVTSMETATENGQMSTETAQDVTETVAAEGASTEQPAASDAESVEDASESTKPAVRPAPPRPVVRDSLGADKKTSDPSHRGNGGRATTEEPADHKAVTAGSSSADSSSTDSASSDGGSSDGDSGGSR